MIAIAAAGGLIPKLWIDTETFAGWSVSVPCPFGCVERMHSFDSAEGDLPAQVGEWLEYCNRAHAFYSVVVPESLRVAARGMSAVAS